MALVFDSPNLTLPLASHSSPLIAPPPPLLHSPLRPPSFPKCSGLRLLSPPSKPSLLPFSPHPSPRFSKGPVCERQQETIAPGEVNDKTWKQLVLGSDIPVLVDFWAPWCGPCRMIAPLIDELAVQYAGRIRCLKLNTDESPNTATEYGIRSIPTVMIFKSGEKRDTIIGAVPKAALISTIEKFLDW